MPHVFNNKTIKMVNSLLLALSVVACSTNQINTTSLNNDNSKSSFLNNKNDFDLNKIFKIKYASGFNPMAYFLTYQDIRDSIKNKTIPDAFYHHFYTQVTEPSRLTNPTYLQTKTRLESGEFSEEAYLIANPDVKSAVDAGTVQSGYAHWYSYASTNETTRKTKQEYIDAKAAIDAGFNETAYRMAHTDIDNLVKNNTIPNAYTHYHTWARNNETSRVTDTRYVKIKNAVLEGYNEQAYLLAYPDVRNQVNSGFFPKGIDHYINYGLNEGRLERDIYQDAKLAIVNDFDETRYRNAYPDVLNGINLFWFTSAFEHFRLYGRYEGRMNRFEYLNTKTEFLVNTYTTNHQNNSSVAMDNAGNYVVVWQSQNQASGTSNNDIYAQRYSSNGTQIGTEFLVNTYTTGVQRNQSVAIDNAGNFVVVWESVNQAGASSFYDIYAQRYSSNGTQIGTEFLVNTYTTNNQVNSSIAMDNVGNFVVTWISTNQASASSNNDIYAQRYSSATTLTTIGSEFLVNTYTTSIQTFPSVAMDNVGNFVVTWISSNQAGASSSSDIYAQRYSSVTTLTTIGSEFRVNTYTTNIQQNQSVATDNAGNFVVVWESQNQAGTSSSTDVYGQRYSSATTLTTIGSEFLVNTYTTNTQGVASIAIDNAGNFVITWESRNQVSETSLFDIYVKRYTS